jgi:Carboxypeptidase regulatory-like domain
MTALALLLLLISAQSRQNPPPSSSSFSIAGVVVDALTGAPVPRAEVSIFANNDEFKMTTGADGRFQLPAPEPGPYPIFAEAHGYVRESLDQHGSYSTGVAVGNGLDSEHLVFRLDPQAVIYGTVSDEHGDAVRHANVQLFSRSNARGARANLVQPRNQTQTDDLGEFRFPHLLPGKYFAVVQAQPWYAQTGFRSQTNTNQNFSGLRRANWNVDPSLDVVYPLTFYPGVFSERSASELDVAAGGQLEANIHMQAVPSVHVLLTNLPIDQENPNGINISATQKVLGSVDLGMAVAVTQIAPGEYEVAGLAPGELTFIVGARSIRHDQHRTFSTNVADGNTIDTASTAGPAASVSGRVILPPAAEHFEQGSLTLVGEGNRGLSAIIQKDGSFSFSSVQAGTYKPVANIPPGGNYVQRISASGARVQGREITLDGTHDAQLILTLASGVGRLAGLARLDGKPKSGVMILLEPESAQNFDDDRRMDQSDSDGTFNLRDILPGKYFLMAIDGGWDLDWNDPAVRKPFHHQAQVIQIAPADSMKVTLAVQSSVMSN